MLLLLPILILPVVLLTCKPKGSNQTETTTTTDGREGSKQLKTAKGVVKKSGENTTSVAETQLDSKTQPPSLQKTAMSEKKKPEIVQKQSQINEKKKSKKSPKKKSKKSKNEKDEKAEATQLLIEDKSNLGRSVLEIHKESNEYELAAHADGATLDPRKVKRLGMMDAEPKDLEDMASCKAAQSVETDDKAHVSINEGKCLLFETPDKPTEDDDQDDEGVENDFMIY